MNTPSKQLNQLLNEIEAIRVKRHQRYRRDGHPQFKLFTQQELNDSAFPSYKNYLNGRTRKLPPREAILSMSAYLECTTEETNDLLMCAGYMPLADDPDGATLGRLLEDGRATLHALPFPAVLSTRDWRVHGMNVLYTSLWNVPTWEQTPPDRQHNLHLLFHADFAGRRPPQTRIETLRGALGAFYTHNHLFVHDHWFQQFVEIGNRYADFRQLWREVTVMQTAFQNTGEVFVARSDSIFRFRFLHMSVGLRLYPVITAFIPLDEDAQRILAASDPRGKLPPAA